MNHPEIYQKLTVIFGEIFEDETIVPTPEMTATDVDGWDSFTHINIMVAVESRFKIKFKTAELESLKSVGQLVDLIARKTSPTPVHR